VRQLILDVHALEDLQWWLKTDKRATLKILQLMEETLRDPFSGKGKPEALRFDLSGCWSRRINLEHRLVYEVTDSHIRVLSCRFHYRA
jgi:toxin YoeB